MFLNQIIKFFHDYKIDQMYFSTTWLSKNFLFGQLSILKFKFKIHIAITPVLAQRN